MFVLAFPLIGLLACRFDKVDDLLSKISVLDPQGYSYKVASFLESMKE